MRVHINQLPKTLRADYLLDTCFFIHMFDQQLQHKLLSFCTEQKVAMTSFNLEELWHIHHRLHGHTIRHMRTFFGEKALFEMPISVYPGHHEAEVRFCNMIHPDIIHVIHDHSDAVLFAAALRTKATILTHDKHHLFTAAAQHFALEHNTNVLHALPV